MTKNDIIIPGALYPVKEIRPTVADEISRRKNINEAYRNFTSMRVPAEYELTWESPELQRFTTGHSLKARGKLRIMDKLHLIPTPVIRPSSNEDAPQMPMYFPELAGFGELAEGSMNATNASSTGPAVNRDIWGNLTSILTKAGESWTAIQTSKYQAQAAASQAEISRSQEAIAKLQSMAGQARQVAEENWPWILAAAGGGILLYFLTKGKKRK